VIRKYKGNIWDIFYIQSHQQQLGFPSLWDYPFNPEIVLMVWARVGLESVYEELKENGFPGLEMVRIPIGKYLNTSTNCSDTRTLIT
jgi:hypothetical protein